MKIPVRILILVLALPAGLMQNALAAVTFVNTPTATSNTYNGTLMLQIGGLATGDTVVVQKFLDINTNGFIDGHDLLVQQFSLTDGTNFVIGGVTNYDVPGDLNPAAGAITATLQFNNGDFVQNIVGKYLYKLSSPAGHFTPLTNNFSVTNFPFAQKFTGNVVSNSTGTTLSNAIVLLFPPPRPGHNGPGQPLAGTVANKAGAYTIQAPAGSYTLLAFCTNYVGNLEKAPLVALGSGLTVSTNLSLTNCTASISGNIVDANNTSVGLPGVFMPAQSTNGLLASSFTDTNGNFIARVTGGQWGLASDDSGLIIHGYVGYQNSTNVNSGAMGVTVPFPKATAMFYGSVKDSLGNPLAGLDVNDSDTNNLYSMDGYTDANGNYFVGALGLGNNDAWQLGLSSESTSSLTNYIFSQPQLGQNGDTNLSAGQAVLVNFTALLATNIISGSLKDTSNNPVTNVQVYASAMIGGVSYQSQANTDGNGNYSMNAANGSWSVNVFCGGGQNSLPTNYQCPNSVTVTIANNNVMTNFVVQLCNGVTITTASPLPAGEVNLPYNQFLNASSCNSSFTWTNTSGSAALPPGLSFFSNGQLSGTPTVNGVYLFTAEVTDGNNATTNRQFSVTISNAVQVTTTSLPNGTNGVAYSQQLQAAGGLVFGGPVPYSWSFSPGSFNPPINLNLATNGVLSGLAATNGTFNFTVRATDAAGGTSDQPLSLTLLTTNTPPPPPPVGIASAGGQVLVFYPQSGSNYVLQTATNLSGPWVTATGGVPAISLFFSNNTPVQFYRLH